MIASAYCVIYYCLGRKGGVSRFRPETSFDSDNKRRELTAIEYVVRIIRYQYEWEQFLFLRHAFSTFRIEWNLFIRMSKKFYKIRKQSLQKAVIPPSEKYILFASNYYLFQVFGKFIYPQI